LVRTFFVGKVAFMASRYDEQARAKAIRLVTEHRDDYATGWRAITTVASRLGMSAETLRKWVRRAEVDNGDRGGVSSEQAKENRELKRKVRELEQTVETLRLGHAAAEQAGTVGPGADWDLGRLLRASRR
jgi:transposase